MQLQLIDKIVLRTVNFLLFILLLVLEIMHSSEYLVIQSELETQCKAICKITTIIFYFWQGCKKTATWSMPTATANSQCFAVVSVAIARLERKNLFRVTWH